MSTAERREKQDEGLAWRKSCKCTIRKENGFVSIRRSRRATVRAKLLVKVRTLIASR